MSPLALGTQDSMTSLIEHSDVQPKYTDVCVTLDKLNSYLFELGSPTDPVFTTGDPATAVFGFCTRKWGIQHILVYYNQSPKIGIRQGTSVSIYEN